MRRLESTREQADAPTRSEPQDTPDLGDRGDLGDHDDLERESQWVRAAQAGDAAAFQALYQRYGRAVRCVVLAHAGWSHAEDLSQEVFLQAWQRLDQLRDATRFAPWLMQSARNRCRDHHRRERPRGPMPERSAPMAPRLEALEVFDAIAKLPPAYRETLLMRLVEGMSGPEIAARSGLTPGSVRVNLHRGLERLRAELAAREETR